MSSNANDQQYSPYNDQQTGTGQPLVAAQPAPYSGSPEVPASFESAPAAAEGSPEYGDELLNQIEAATERTGEQKEVQQPPVVQSPQQPAKVEAKPKPQQPSGPRIFGYTIPRHLSSPEKIMQMKGKGNPAEASTWIAVLLDRLLKQRTHSD